MRLNERVVPDAITCIGRSTLLYVGSLGRVDWHSHGVPVFIAGLAGPFRLAAPDGEWLTCQAAVIPAGVPHALDLHGHPLAVFYAEPWLAGLRDLARLGRSWHAHGRILLGEAADLSVFRALYEDDGSLAFAHQAVDRLVEIAHHGDGPPDLDPRLAGVLAWLETHPDDLSPVAARAAAAGLSASRFQHVFSRDIGVPFRYFRIWNRLRATFRLHLAGRTLTDAAIAAGFADSAHFSRLYRRTFGFTHSQLHRRVARACDLARPDHGARRHASYGA
jgi:AraC-like DNA-binding protein